VETYPHIPQKADYVIYWWDKAAELASENSIVNRVHHDQQRYPALPTSSLAVSSRSRFSLHFAIQTIPGSIARTGLRSCGDDSSQASDGEGRLLTVLNESFGEDDAAILLSTRSKAPLMRFVVWCRRLESRPIRANDNRHQPGVQNLWRRFSSSPLNVPHHGVRPLSPRVERTSCVATSMAALNASQ